MSAPNKNPKRRVKVYLLNAEGQWLDLGTGHVQVVFSEAAQETYFVVRADTNQEEVVLESRIFPDDIYQRQQDTLIVWQEPDTGRDIALSFQEPAGCVEVWELLGVLRGSKDGPTSLDGALELPAPTADNLAEIFDSVQAHLRSISECEQLCHWIVKKEYFVQLFDVFDECEATGNVDALFMVFRIFRALLFANNVSLLEVVLADDYVLRFFGALEYDPRAPPNRWVKHREFLANARLQEVVPLDNDTLRTRIRQTYHIQYLRDVILAGVIDDGISSTINSFVIYNQMEIVSLVRRDPDVLQNLLRQMQDPEMTDEAFFDKCSFILELCTLGKICNVAGRIELYSLLTSLGVFQVLELALRRSDIRIRTAACEIINLTVHHNVSLLRSYVLNQASKPSFLSLLVDGIVSETDSGLKSQFSGIVMALLDPEGMEKVNAKDQMLGIWYESCMSRLMEPLGSPLDENVPTKEHVIDLLEFCIRCHDFRVKYFILGNNITKRVVALTQHRDRYLQLAAVRLIRVIVGIRDSFFDRHICRHHFLDPIITLLVENKGANNLVDSAILDMLEFIRTSPVPDLARELVSRHREALLNVRYVSTCTQLVQMVDAWEKDLSGGPSATPPVQMDSPTRKRPRGGSDGLDDAWFEDDDELNHGGNRGPSNGSGTGSVSARSSEQQQQQQPEVMMDFSILPPLPALTRRGDDDDGDLPLLNRTDTPPMLDMSQPRTTPNLSFSSLRLPSDPNALVAGLAAEATRLVAESGAGGPFWGALGEKPASPVSPPAPVSSPSLPRSPGGGSPKLPEHSRDSPEQKRRKVPPLETVSLVDEFLNDAAE